MNRLFMKSIIQTNFTNLLVPRFDKLLNLEQLKLYYEEQLSLMRTFSISLLEQIFVIHRLTGPKEAVSESISLTVLTRTIPVAFRFDETWEEDAQ